VPSATGPKKKIPNTKEKKTLVGLVVCFSQQHFPTISSSSTATILCSRKTQTLVKGRNQLKTELALGNNRATKTIEKKQIKKKTKPNQTPTRNEKARKTRRERERAKGHHTKSLKRRKAMTKKRTKRISNSALRNILDTQSAVLVTRDAGGPRCCRRI